MKTSVYENVMSGRLYRSRAAWLQHLRQCLENGEASGSPFSEAEKLNQLLGMPMGSAGDSRRRRTYRKPRK